MIRFPNPGSRMANFVAVYKAIFKRYYGQTVDIDDLVRATVEANLATSSGYMGEEAIMRSTRNDRSRDPLYNQLKMYAELFRSLGWIRSTEKFALKYNFTLLGEQVIAAEHHWQLLVGETVLGIAYPNHAIELQVQYDIRPFATILITMLSCNNGLSRDEMIVGPLNAMSDRSKSNINNIIKKIMKLRKEPNAIQVALDELQEARNIQINTMRNYTRWPLAVLRDLKWVEEDREFYQQSKKAFQIYRLTKFGKSLAHNLEKTIDLRIDQVDSLSYDQKFALSRYAHFSMMERAGFDISSVSGQLQQDKKICFETLQKLELPTDKPILFSPFQALSIKDLSKIFSQQDKNTISNKKNIIINNSHTGRDSRSHLFVNPIFVSAKTKNEERDINLLKSNLKGFYKIHSSVNLAANDFVHRHREDGKIEFYPLVTNLLQLIGLKSHCSRFGVNSQRWDAYIYFNNLMIPIEIKSPTEELFLSTKAIRQAIENKVILLARNGIQIQRELSTLIVGYHIPNERAEMSMLIDDVYSTFGFRIGVIDLYTLTYIAIRAVTESIAIDEDQIYYMRGFLHV